MTMTCEYQPPRAPGDVRYTKRKCTTHEIEFLDDWGCPVGVLQNNSRPQERATGDDEPLTIAWKAYLESIDYTSSRKWFQKPENAIASQWSSFAAGFRAALLNGEAKSAVPCCAVCGVRVMPHDKNCGYGDDEAHNLLADEFSSLESDAKQAEDEIQELRGKLERVIAALAYDSREHHSDSSCTTRCMEGFRARIEDAISRPTPGAR